jgi:hypothetical protein
MIDRQIISVLILIFAVSVFAEIPQQSETTLSPPIRYSPWVPLLGSQMAPSINSTEGPAGRPNLELVPLSTGVLNSLTPSMKESNTKRKATAKNVKNEIFREATSPLPNSSDKALEKGLEENPIKANQNRQ